MKQTLTLPNKSPPPPPASPHEPFMTLYQIIVEEMDRVGHNKKAIFDAATTRILGDEELFRRIGTALLHRSARKRIKNLMRGLTALQQAGKQGDAA